MLFDRYFFTFILLVVAHPLWCQVDSSTVTLKKVWNPNFTIKITPLRAIEPYNTYQLGVEYRLSYRSTLEHEIGYGTGTYPREDTLDTEPTTDLRRIKSFRLNTNWKVYLGPEKMKGTYLGLALGYRYSTLLAAGVGEEVLVQGVSLLVREPRDFSTIKQDFTCRLLLGKQEVSGRFLIDYYVGIGFKYLMVDTEEGSGLLDDENWIIELDHMHTGNYFLPAFALGFKVGFLFHKRE
ncbi:MAG: hypothetical protein AAF734_01450 [Bacteroidota bacterium]